MSPTHNLAPSEIIDIIQLAWLPGSEAGLRIWSGAVEKSQQWYSNRKVVTHSETPVGNTVFLNEDHYSPPALGGKRTHYCLGSTNGWQSGLLARENTASLITGIRGFTADLLKRNTQFIVAEIDEYRLQDGEQAQIQMEVDSVDTIIAEDGFD